MRSIASKVSGYHLLNMSFIYCLNLNPFLLIFLNSTFDFSILESILVAYFLIVKLLLLHLPLELNQELGS